MNRLFLTAAAAATMAFSAQASLAATHVVDDFSDGVFFTSLDAHTQSDDQTLASTGYHRTIDYTATLVGPTQYFEPESMFETANGQLNISNEDGVTANVLVHYDIASLAGTLTQPLSAVSFTVIASGGASLPPTSIVARLNGSFLGQWTATTPIPGGTPGYTEEGYFTFASSLLGNGDLSLEFDGPNGYDLTITSVSIADVSPVPEPGEWAMLVAGLAVVGATARRRSARRV